MPPATAPRPVVIDTDPGIDDALALMLALRSPELRVELITTVAGNVPVRIATDNTRRLLALLAPAPWPVVAQGAARPLRRAPPTVTHVHGEDGLGGLTQLQQPDGSPRYPLPRQPAPQQQAVQRLLAMVEKYRQDLTIIALGPLTNLARAVEQAPDTMRQLGRLVIMGGAIGVPGNVTPVAEFNIFVDPHAAAIVFAAGLPITLIPLDVTRQVRLTSQFLDQTIRGSGTKLTQAIRQMVPHMLQGADRQVGLAMHDPLAVAVGIEPALVTCTPLPLYAETQGQHTLGMTVADRRTPARQEATTARIEVALEVDAPRVLALFAERVLLPQRPAAARVQPGPTTMAVRSPRVIVVGSANTDLTVRTPHLPAAGETVHGSDVYTSYGGKGANQAVAARRAGAQVFFLAKLGRDRYGQDYADYLRQQGLDLAGLRWEVTLPSGMALITVDRRGRNQIAVAPGANSALQPGDLDGLEDHFQPGTVLLTQLEVPLPTVETALRRAKAANLTTILNPAPARRLPARFARLVDLLIPNEVEAALLCGHPVRSLAQAKAAALRLRQAGYATVVITLGKNGVAYTVADTVMHLPAFAVRATDTTAAGDTFMGYLGYALATGCPLPAALRLAGAAAAMSVTRVGAQSSIPQQHEVQQFLAEHPADTVP